MMYIQSVFLILLTICLLRQAASSAYKTCVFQGLTLEKCRYYVDGEYVDIEATINACVQPNDVKVSITMASQATWTHTFVNKNEIKEVEGLTHQVSLQLILSHNIVGQLKIEARFLVEGAPLFPFITDTVAIPASPNCFTPLGGALGLAILIIFVILVILIIISIVCFIIIRHRRRHNPEHLITNEHSDPKDDQENVYTTTVISNDTIALPKIKVELVGEPNEEAKDKVEVNGDKELNQHEDSHAQKGNIVNESGDISVPSRGKFHDSNGMFRDCDEKFRDTNGKFHNNDNSREFHGPHDKIHEFERKLHETNEKSLEINQKLHYDLSSKESCQENGAVGGIPKKHKKKHRSKKKYSHQPPNHHKSLSKHFMVSSLSVESIKEDDMEFEGNKIIEII